MVGGGYPPVPLYFSHIARGVTPLFDLVSLHDGGMFRGAFVIEQGKFGIGERKAAE